MKRKIRIFISYQHANARVMRELEDHLGWLKNSDNIDIFDDRKILAGESWDNRIVDELKRSDIIILVITARFMNSSYCTKIELIETLKHQNNRNVRVIPIVAEACDWVAMPTRVISALPKDHENNLKPLNKWGRDRDLALTQIAEQVRKNVEILQGCVHQQDSNDDLTGHETPWYLPIVMIIDDNRLVLRRWAHELLKIGIGTICCDNLMTARVLFEQYGDECDAVIADIVFEEGTTDEINELYDGVDFLQLVSRKRNDILLFMMSAWVEMDDTNLRAHERGITLANVFDKFNAGEGSCPAWLAVKLEIIRKLERGLQYASGGHWQQTDVAHYEALAQAIQFPTRTYLTALQSDEFEIVKPIEVICICERNLGVRAIATSVGFCASAHGRDIFRAIENIERSIVDLAKEVVGATPSRMTGKGQRRAVDQFRAHIRKRKV